MKKIVKEITIDYIFEADRKGAKYSFDGGEHFCNGGDFLEITAKHENGFNAKKDANTPFDKGSDIEEIKTSVKSSKFTLTSEKLADTFEESKNVYFQRVHSNKWWYVVRIDDTIIIYVMNKSEFSEFLDNWASLNERGVIRGKATSAKMLLWLDEMVDRKSIA